MGVGWGLRVEVEVLDDERTSTPAAFKDLGRCLTLPAAAPCRLIGLFIVECGWRHLGLLRWSPIIEKLFCRRLSIGWMTLVRGECVLAVVACIMGSS